MVRVSGLVLFSLVLVWFGLFFLLVWSGGLVFSYPHLPEKLKSKGVRQVLAVFGFIFGLFVSFLFP